MVGVQNLTAAHVDVPFVRRVVQKTLQNFRTEEAGELGIAFVGQALMQRLNATYHHEDRVTDVLSFPSSPTFPIPELDGRRYVGEIVVCVPVLKKEALDTRVPYRRVLAHVLIHGTLHLLGYTHEKSDKDTARMHAREEKIMRKLGIMNQEFGK